MIALSEIFVEGGYILGKRKYLILLAVLVTTLLPMMGTVYGAPKEESKKLWNIPFLGTMQVPDRVEIVDGKDVVGQIMKMSNSMAKANSSPAKRSNVKMSSPEEISAMFDDNKIGIYEFAVKNNGAYNIALVFAGKIPTEGNASGLAFFEKLKNSDKEKQVEIHKIILNGINEAYGKVPELKDMFELEILEFYPFEQLTNKNAQIISVGGSVAVRTFKMIRPVAFKVYFINKDSELYVFGVINSGLDRQMWDTMSKEMLSSARWSLF